MALYEDESVFGKSMMKYFMYFIMALSLGASVLGMVSPGMKSTIGNALQGEIVKLYGTFSTMAFFYMVMGEEKDSREMFRMAILLIAASSILTSSYGASDSIALGGGGIFISMFFGKLLKKYISGGAGESAISAGISSYNKGGGFWSGFSGSAVDKLGPEEPESTATKVELYNYAEGSLALGDLVTTLYQTLSAYHWTQPHDSNKAKLVIEAVDALEGKLDAACTSKRIKEDTDVKQIVAAMKTAVADVSKDFKDAANFKHIEKRLGAY